MHFEAMRCHQRKYKKEDPSVSEIESNIRENIKARNDPSVTYFLSI